MTPGATTTFQIHPVWGFAVLGEPPAPPALPRPIRAASKDVPGAVCGVVERLGEAGQQRGDEGSNALRQQGTPSQGGESRGRNHLKVTKTAGSPIPRCPPPCSGDLPGPSRTERRTRSRSRGIVQRFWNHHRSQGGGGPVLRQPCAGETPVQLEAQPDELLQAVEPDTRAGLGWVRPPGSGPPL